MAKTKRYVHQMMLNAASGMVKPDIACIQFVVNNPSTKVLKISQKTALTTQYEYLVKAGSVFVSPKFNFTELSFVIDAYTDGLYLLPIIYCYDVWVGTPGSTTL
jgi:hypothetical protein